MSLSSPLPSYNPPGRNSKYLYSYSGADADTFAWFPDAPEELIHLQSVHTVSVSVHEAKGQVRALGHRGIKGLARGVRTIAGSIIMTVINDHPLRELMNAYASIYGTQDPLGWSIDRHMVGTGSFLNNYDYTNRLAVLLRPFNLAIQYVSEVSPLYDESKGETPDGAGWMLQGVEFIDEGQVTSVNDIVTEMTFSFIACDFKPFSLYTNRGISAEEMAYLDNLRSERKLYEALIPKEDRFHVQAGDAWVPASQAQINSGTGRGF